METFVTFSVRDDVGVIVINNPPVNALSSGVLEGLKAAVHTLEGNADVRAIVVIGGGRTFVAGADINQFVEIVAGRGTMPAFHPVLNAIEDCAKPVIMAIHGTALGGGLELAMAGHYRVATPDAQVGQPEVKIGLIPGAGGTQRLAEARRRREGGRNVRVRRADFGEGCARCRHRRPHHRGRFAGGCDRVRARFQSAAPNPRPAGDAGGHIRSAQKASGQFDRAGSGARCGRSGDDAARSRKASAAKRKSSSGACIRTSARR